MHRVKVTGAGAWGSVVIGLCCITDGRSTNHSPPCNLYTVHTHVYTRKWLLDPPRGHVNLTLGVRCSLYVKCAARKKKKKASKQGGSVWGLSMSP